MRSGIRGGIKAFERVRALVKALLLLILDLFARLWASTSIFCSSESLSRRLTQGLYQIQNLGVIIKNKD